MNLGNISASASPYLNVTAITTNSAYGASSGIDGLGDTYSANAMATSAAGSGATPAWNGQTFELGPFSINNAVQATGQTINLPQGYYTSLQLLGTATGGAPQSGTFTVNYVGGGTATFTQTLSDWKNGYTGGGTTAPGESIVSAMTSYNTNSSGNKSGNVYLYGYVFPVNPAKEVASIAFPNNADIKILAIDEINEPAQVNLGDVANSATPPFNVSAITFNTHTGVSGGGFDGSGDTYSANALVTADGSASSLAWNSETFFIGPVFNDSAVQASGQSITLPEGSFSSIQLLGAATGGTAQSVTFTVYYVGGGTSNFTQTFSDWKNGYTGGGTTAPGESIASTMLSYNTTAGNTSGKVYLYGYSFSTNSAKTISSITFPNKSQIKILAIDEVNQSEQYMFVLGGGDQGLVSPGTGTAGLKTAPAAPERTQSPASLSPTSGTLLSLAIDGVVSSRRMFDYDDDLSPALDPAVEASAMDESAAGVAVGAIALGPIPAPLAPVADCLRLKIGSNVPPP